MSYQEVTGTLNPGAHPGSYNGQDAWSDLLVTDNVDLLERNRYLQHTDIKKRRGGQRMPDKDNFNAVCGEPAYMSDRKGNNGIT